jgi:hypothetical protein
MISNESTFIRFWTVTVFFAGSIFTTILVANDGWTFLGTLQPLPTQEERRLEKGYANILNDAQSLQEQQNYGGCMTEAAKITDESSDSYSGAKKIWRECQRSYQETELKQAQKYASEDSFKEAIASVKNLPGDEAKKLINEWSQQMTNTVEGYLNEAKKGSEKAIEGCETWRENLNHAKHVISNIPHDTTAHRIASEKLEALESDRSNLCMIESQNSP